MNIPALRLSTQNISVKRYKTPKEILGHMGAIQAQDYPMSKWGIGVRLKNSTEEIINEAIDKGEILRTHVLRPTWHLVSAENIGWMLNLTASKIKSSMSSRNKQLELTREVFRKSGKVISNALRGNNHLTRDELIKILNKAKIKTDENRASHILMEAELSGIICSGTKSSNKHSYALFEERIPQIKSLTKEDSLEKLARIYFTSRGPASEKDFSWWGGINLTEARLGIELIKSDLNSFKSNSGTYWHFKNQKIKSQKNNLFLLPTYDEYIISYADRNDIVSSEDHLNIISTYGLFRAVIIYGGKSIGTWKRTIKKDKVTIEFNFFEKPDNQIKELAIAEAEKFGKFLNNEVEVII